MRVFDTTNLQPTDKLSRNHASWIYNGLDCCVTLEVRNKLREQLAAEPQNVRDTYTTAMEKFAPVNYMNLHGLRVNKGERDRVIAEYAKSIALYQSRFDELCTEVIGYTINWRSPVQLKSLFYDTFKLKPVRKRNASGEFAPTVNADALERFTEHYYVQVFARYILAMRVLGKRIGFLQTEVDPDGFMRTSLNIAGTDTGRFSSKFSALGTGSNLQNVEDRLRRVFIPDEEDQIFVNVDLSQADARNVGARIYTIFYDEFGPEAAGSYLDACESGDLHTAVTRMVWPDLGWTGDLKADRKIADQPFYREYSYRDMSKRLGHGTNYFGTPPTMAKHTKVDVQIIERFQRAYFTAYPLIGNIDKDLTRNDWHGWVYRQLRDVGAITNLFGRRRIFFDRYKELTTLRAAIAYDPQSNTGEELDRGWLSLWNANLTYNGRPAVRLKLPVHDSILLSVPYSQLSVLMPQILELLKVTIELPGGRKFSVPLDAAVGWNWGKAKFDKKTGLWENPNGLREWTGKEEREPPQRRVSFSKHLGR